MLGVRDRKEVSELVWSEGGAQGEKAREVPGVGAGGGSRVCGLVRT